MQAKASGVLQIKVSSVKTKVGELETQTTTHFKAKAKIIGVTRSQSGLTKGNASVTESARNVWRTKFAQTGPEPNPTISKGDRCPAHFVEEGKGRAYGLAAEAYGFEKLNRPPHSRPHRFHLTRRHAGAGLN